MFTEPQFYTAAFLFPDYFQDRELKRGSKPSSRLGEVSALLSSPARKRKDLTQHYLVLFLTQNILAYLASCPLLPQDNISLSSLVRKLTTTSHENLRVIKSLEERDFSLHVPVFTNGRIPCQQETPGLWLTLDLSEIHPSIFFLSYPPCLVLQPPPTPRSALPHRDIIYSQLDVLIITSCFKQEQNNHF